MKLELLAPAGGYEALVAAVNNGADAVYTGGKSFSARAYADNLSEYELYKAIDYCHLYDRKLYLTLNTLYDGSEITDVLHYAENMYKHGMDAFIVQDLGTAVYMVKSGLPVHASTQMTVHNLNTVLRLKNIGIKRIVLSRELRLKEIEYITKEACIEIEVFVHGALCFCYSGQCLMSSFIGGRSGNRGRCAQPCRKRYALVGENMETINKKDVYSKGYLMSMKDLNTLDRIDSLKRSGVTSLKIEGRMKRPEYVALVVNAYRKAIDKKLKKEDVLKAEAIFNRGFTKGYIFGDKNREVINIKNPKNTGEKVGTLTGIRGGTGYFDFDAAVSLGDGLSVGDDGFIIVSMKQKDKNIEKAVGRTAIPLKGKKIKSGDVYRTFDAHLIREAKKTYERSAAKMPLEAYLTFRIGHPFKVRIKYKDKDVCAQSEAFVEEAVNRPLPRKRLIEQINKTGNTPFYFDKIELDFDDNAAVAVSVINDVRRRAIEKLMEEILKRNIVIKDTNLSLKEVKKDIKRIKVLVKTNDLSEVGGIIESGADGIYYEGFNDKDIIKAYRAAKDGDAEFIYVLPVILRDGNYKKLYDKLNNLRGYGINKFLLGNLGEIDMLLNTDIKYMDLSLNVFNGYSALELKQMGAAGVCISPELKIGEIKKLTLRTDLSCELYGYGFMPVMISEYDITCGADAYGVKDPKGEVFPVKRDEITHIFNSKPVYLADKINDFKNTGIDRLRLDFTVKHANVSYKDIIKSYITALNGNIKYAIFIREALGDFTRGHYYKGVE